MNKESMFELATKEPLAIPETDAERLLRLRAENQYLTLNGGHKQSYEAGWKAAKVYYEQEKQ